MIKFCPFLNGNCKKDECALWLKVQNACSVQVFARVK